MKSDSYYRKMFSRNQSKYRERLKEKGKKQLNVYIDSSLFDRILEEKEDGFNNSQTLEKILNQWISLKEKGKKEKEPSPDMEDMTDIEKEILSLSKKNISYPQICKILNDKGYVNPNTGKEWKKESVRRIVKKFS